MLYLKFCMYVGSLCASCRLHIEATRRVFLTVVLLWIVVSQLDILKINVPKVVPCVLSCSRFVIVGLLPFAMDALRLPSPTADESNDIFSISDEEISQQLEFVEEVDCPSLTTLN